MYRVVTIEGADRHFPVDKKMELPLSYTAGENVCQPGHINCFPTIWPLLAELTATLDQADLNYPTEKTMNSLIHVGHPKTVAAYDTIVGKAADVSSYQRGCADAHRRTTCTESKPGLKRSLL